MAPRPQSSFEYVKFCFETEIEMRMKYFPGKGQAKCPLVSIYFKSCGGRASPEHYLTPSEKTWGQMKTFFSSIPLPDCVGWCKEKDVLIVEGSENSMSRRNMVNLCICWKRFFSASGKIQHHHYSIWKKVLWLTFVEIKPGTGSLQTKILIQQRLRATFLPW